MALEKIGSHFGLTPGTKLPSQALREIKRINQLSGCGLVTFSIAPLQATAPLLALILAVLQGTGINPVCSPGNLRAASEGGGNTVNLILLLKNSYGAACSGFRTTGTGFVLC